jgi:hypothetical protein
MRWSYVLRSRERWRDSPDASARHQADATATLHAFGLGDAPSSRSRTQAAWS